jgi:hypothetical protein
MRATNFWLKWRRSSLEITLTWQASMFSLESKNSKCAWRLFLSRLLPVMRIWMMNNSWRSWKAQETSMEWFTTDLFDLQEDFLSFTKSFCRESMERVQELFVTGKKYCQSG